MRGYVAAGLAADERIPPQVRSLPAGRHEIRLGGAPFRVAVADRDGDRYYILFDEERQKLREQRFLGYLIAGAALMTLLASVGGFWLAGRVIAPVTELARAVRKAPPENPPRLAVDGEPDDELAELAAAGPAARHGPDAGGAGAGQAAGAGGDVRHRRRQPPA